MRAIIVSGSSTGIGKDVAMTLAKSGFLVFAGVRKNSDFKAFEGFSQIVPVVMDVAILSSVLAAKKQIASELETRRIKVREWSLVNNAGIVVSGPIEGLTDEQWQSQFDVNVFGLLRMTREFLPLIRETQGYIINIGSISGIVSTPFLGPY
ncbi:MAG: SDR family NAD(P)-dependent oxidoreductase, partial [Bdellovibrionales bacterium]|nr:SDR family NAD(P)-dependent oxidoreductase [Bdellovibrionales bacterium]